MSMNNKDIVILTTWDKEEIIVELNMEDWIMIKSDCKSNWEDWVFINALQRYIKFSNIKNEQWKTQFISDTKKIEAPKKIELTPAERKIRDKMISEMLEKTYEWRKKTFFKVREWILKQLAKSEKRFNLQTTLEKLEELNKLRQKNILINNK